MSSWVILDGFDRASADGAETGSLLRSRLAQSGVPYTCFRLEEMEIAACRSCGACGYKSPGRCVIEDDLHDVMRAVARADVLACLTPLRFGGYASQIKKTMERFMNLGYPLYIMKDGYLLHPMRYGDKSLLSVALVEADLPGQAENFRLLVKRQARNLLSPHSAAVIIEPGQVAPQLGPAVEEALQWQ